MPDYSRGNMCSFYTVIKQCSKRRSLLLFLNNKEQTTALLICLKGKVTVAFSGHTNLTWIELSSRSNDFFRVDNITFNIPEPSILALTALGLTGLGFSRRRNNVQKNGDRS